MNLPPEDIELVRKLRKGDVEAFDLIYFKYSGHLYRFGLKYLRSDSEAEELVQTVFLKLWENRGCLKEQSSFRSFLFTIAYNDICKIFRRRVCHQKFIDEIISENSGSSFSTEADINYKFFEERIRQIIEMLPDRQKYIFKKSREEGKVTREIADELNLSPGTIDNYISQSLKFIKFHLRNEELAVILCFFLLSS